MIAEDEIRRVAEHIGRSTDAERVVLFGSYARGDALDNSDVDLLIVAERDLPRFKRSRRIYRAMDLVVYTPSEVETAQASPLSFVSTALREGRTVCVR